MFPENLVYMVVVLFLIGAAIVIIKKIRIRRRKHRQEKNEFLDKFYTAMHLGPILCFNERQGILAVCRAEDYDQAWEKYDTDVAGGIIPRSEPIIIQVVPTFTFWIELTHRNYMQSGSKNDFETIQKEWLEAVTGLTSNQIYQACLNGWIDFYQDKRLLKTLFQQRPNLFVPFCSGHFLPRHVQEDVYPKYGLEEVRAFLIDKTPLRS